MRLLIGLCKQTVFIFILIICQYASAASSKICLTGRIVSSLPSYGQSFINAAQLAVGDNNASLVEIKTYFYAGSQTGSIEAYKQMISDKCTAIVGYEYLSDLLMVEKYQKMTDIPIFSTYSSSLSSESVPRNIISFVPYYNFLSQKMVEFLVKTEHIEKILIITDVGRDEMLRYKNAYTGLLKDRSIQYATFDYVENDPNYLFNLQKKMLKNKYTELILLTGAIQSADIINATNHGKIEYIGTETFGSSVAPTMFVRLTDKNIKAYLIRNIDYEKPNLALRNFETRYRNKYGYSPTILSVYTYDSVDAIIQAAKKPGSLIDNIYRLNKDFISGAKIKDGSLLKSQNYVILNVDKNGYHLEQ